MERKFIIAGTRKPLLIENVVKMGAKVGGFFSSLAVKWAEKNFSIFTQKNRIFTKLPPDLNNSDKV